MEFQQILKVFRTPIDPQAESQRDTAMERARKTLNAKCCVYDIRGATNQSVVLTPTNALVRQNNEKRYFAIVKNHQASTGSTTWKDHGVLTIRPVLIMKDGVTRFDNDIGVKITDLLHKTSVKVSTKLRAVIHSETYRLTKNGNLGIGIANGSLVKIIDVVLHDDAVPKWSTIDNSFCVDADEVNYLVLRHTSKRFRKAIIHNDLPPGHFLHTIRRQTNDKIIWKKFKVPLGHGCNAHGKLAQFDIAKSFAMTIHRSQGYGFSDIYVVGLTNAKTGNAAGLRSGILYTLLSRATMMSALRIVGGIHETQLPKLRTDVQREMKRILRLSESTLERFHDNNASSTG